jgi:hypothetical protein
MYNRGCPILGQTLEGVTMAATLTNLLSWEKSDLLWFRESGE